MKDAREFVRLLSATLVHLSYDGGESVGTLTDISRSGLRFARYGTQVSLPGDGTRVECSFILPTGLVKAEADVAWSDTETHTVGLEFKELDARSRKIVDMYCDSPW